MKKYHLICNRWTLLVFAICTLAASLACTSTPDIYIEEATDYNALFNTKTGWTGADGAYSIDLSDDEILWLYGDTWVGSICNNKHIDARLINNSIAIQNGKNPESASVAFYFHHTPDGMPDAFIKPDDGKGWFWIYHGIASAEGLYLFLVQIDRSGGTSNTNFKIIGTWLAQVLNPSQAPDHWQIRQQRIPWEHISESGDTIFGSFILTQNGYVYIYGTSEDIIHNTHHKYMILARAPEGSLDDFNAWRFFSSGNWSDDFSTISRICEGLANEYSVSYLSVLNKYVLIYSENSVSENITMRQASTPYGPWSEPKAIYTCPESTWDDTIFCYAAKAHPALSTIPEELIITYVANSTDFWKMAADTRLYRPRFLRLRFSTHETER